MEATAKLYIKIINPQREHYQNRKEYFGIVQSLNALSNYFNIVQVRVALIALLEAKEKDLIGLKQFKEAVYYLDNFHFAYNAVGAKPTNKLETIYSAFAIRLRSCNDKAAARTIIQEMIAQLEEIYISYKDFEEKFVLLTYTKKESPLNLKTKYAINKIAAYYEDSEVFLSEGSIEHILSESSCEESVKIGNLIMLEQRLNRAADTLDYHGKAAVYQASAYKWVHAFVAENDSWNVEKAEKRSKKLAEFYYTNILGKTMPEDR